MLDEPRRPGPLYRLWRRLIGAPRDLEDPGLLRHVSLAAFFAWVGLGADGLSSSAYGPEEAFKALGEHRHLALLLFLMMATTIGVISLAYAKLIEKFPGGGGGYLVASKLLGPRVGVVAGSALLVDYVLTITISVASGCDQLWSFLPGEWAGAKLAAEIAVLALLIVLNLRGVRESVRVLAPIFLLFLVSHAILIVAVLARHLGSVPELVADTAADFRGSVATLGLLPVVLLLLRAYSLGGGTYTGIEAVSNSVPMLREPRVQTGKRTMLLMAVSLAVTAGGILVGYLLVGVEPETGRTLNAVLFERVFGGWAPSGLPAGAAFVVAGLAAEAALLFVAAQAGFLAGPRVMADMALDSWLPHRFSHLSDRLVARNGVVVMGVAAGAFFLYTRGDVSLLVVMYSINVFLTFSLSLLGMFRRSLRARGRVAGSRREALLFGVGVVMCSGILVVTVFEKFASGGWVTLLITGAVLAGCYFVRRHYLRIRRNLGRLDDLLVKLPTPPDVERGGEEPLDPRAPTAVVCVASFSGFGLHQLLSIHRIFPGFFDQFVFVSAAVVDSGIFKGSEELENLQGETELNLRKYVEWARGHGLRAGYRMAVGTEVVETLEDTCRKLVSEFPRAVVFIGKLIFREERWYHRFLHNETAYSIQRRLGFDGIQAMVLSIRVLEE